MYSSPTRLGITFGGDSLFIAAGEWSEGVFKLRRLGRYRFSEDVTEALVRQISPSSGVYASISEWVKEFSPDSIRYHAPSFLECWIRDLAGSERVSHPREERKTLGILFPSNQMLAPGGTSSAGEKIGQVGATGSAGVTHQPSAHSDFALPHASLRKVVYAPFKGTPWGSNGQDRFLVVRERSMTDQIRSHAPGLTREILSEPELGASLAAGFQQSDKKDRYGIASRSSSKGARSDSATRLNAPQNEGYSSHAHASDSNEAQSKSLLSVITHPNGCSLSAFQGSQFLGATQISYEQAEDLCYLLPRYGVELPWLRLVYDQIIVTGSNTGPVLEALTDLEMDGAHIWTPETFEGFDFIQSDESSFGFSLATAFPAVLACMADS